MKFFRRKNSALPIALPIAKPQKNAFKGTSKSAERRRSENREVVHSADPGQTFLVGTTEYLVQKNGSFRRLGPK